VEKPEDTPQQIAKGQLGRLCLRCHQVNRRGSVALCLLFLRAGSACPRRTVLQRHHPDALRPKVTLPTCVEPKPVLSTSQVVLPASPSVPNIITLRARYGDPLGRWRGLFARLPQPSAPGGEQADGQRDD
jgi:hypothetical protein